MEWKQITRWELRSAIHSIPIGVVVQNSDGTYSATDYTGYTSRYKFIYHNAAKTWCERHYREMLNRDEYKGE